MPHTRQESAAHSEPPVLTAAVGTTATTPFGTDCDAIISEGVGRSCDTGPAGAVGAGGLCACSVFRAR
eukprot:3432324-Alexandrium_andersonii.AAC.1